MQKDIKRAFVSSTKWTSLAKIGGSPVGKFISLIPTFAVFLQFTSELSGLQGASQDGFPLVRLSSAFVGLCLLGLGVIIFNLLCPSILREHPTPLSYVALRDLITRERYNNIVGKLTQRSNRLAIRLARSDAGFWLDEGFLLARKGYWEDFEGQPPPSEQVIRVLWYNYVFLDHSMLGTRMVITALFGLGLSFSVPPSLATVFETLQQAVWEIFGVLF